MRLKSDFSSGDSQMLRKEKKEADNFPSKEETLVGVICPL
jgi:hypothetical protein